MDQPNALLGREADFLRATCGNQNALAFLHTIFHAADVADDLHDRDQPASVADLVSSLAMAHAQPFYQQHAAALSSLMLVAALEWDISNELQPGPDAEHYACGLEAVLFYVAMICGGYPHARNVMRAWIQK